MSFSDISEFELIATREEKNKKCLSQNLVPAIQNISVVWRAEISTLFLNDHKRIVPRDIECYNLARNDFCYVGGTFLSILELDGYVAFVERPLVRMKMRGEHRKKYYCDMCAKIIRVVAI